MDLHFLPRLVEQFSHLCASRSPARQGAVTESKRNGGKHHVAATFGCECYRDGLIHIPCQVFEGETPIRWVIGCREALPRRV
jgi:hypothetical protein